MLQTLTSYITLFSIMFYGFLLILGKRARALRGLTALVASAVVVAFVSRLAEGHAWLIAGFCLAIAICIFLALKLFQLLIQLIFGKPVADRVVSGVLLNVFTRRSNH